MIGKERVNRFIGIFIILMIFFRLFIGFGRIRSESMEPEIKKGSFVFYERFFNEKKLYPGNIIIFKYNDCFICHRIIEKRGNTLITKGDANDEQDPPITSDDVEGILIQWKGERQ